jgi:Holliday junction DNA helicase RuvA
LITRITGKLTALTIEAATLEAAPFEYEVHIPEFTRRRLQLAVGETVSLHTIYQLDGNITQGKVQPKLIGFSTPIEREFFEMFCSVDGVGSKKALRAMIRSVQDIAEMIERQNVKELATLPGIGAAMGERIVAKLRRKMSKFALLVGKDSEGGTIEVESDVVSDTYQVLLSLGHNELESRKLIDDALAGKKKYKDVESLIQAIYDRKAAK